MMPILPQRLVTHLLLAVYGGVAVLGYGLHELSPAHHHHTDATAGLCVGHHHSHGHCDHSHHGHEHHSQNVAQSQSQDQDQGPALSSIAHAHDCEICVFLDQNRSFQAQIDADYFSQPFAGEVSVAAPRLESLAIAGLHAPRGPPSLLG